MFQIKVPKNGYENTYCIYNTNELVIIMPQTSTTAILNLPYHYKCIGTNPLTVQNTAPVVVNLDSITNYIYQNNYCNEPFSYTNESVGCINPPFGYKIEEQDYLELEQIAMQTYQDWESEQKLETEQDLSQVKLWPYYNQPQLQSYNQPQPQQMQPQQMQPQQMQPQQMQPQQMQPQQMQPQIVQPQQMQQQMQQQYAQPQKYLRRY